MLIWLTGNDSYKCDRVILDHKSKLDPTWLLFNFHVFSTDVEGELEQAAIESTTLPFGSPIKLLVVQGDLKPDHEFQIRRLVDAPDFSTIILRVSVDARTKVGKLIKSKATAKEYNLPSIWKQGALAMYIQQEAVPLGLRLTPQIADYLAEAIGEDSYRIHNELAKIALFADTKGLIFSLNQVKELVPNLNQNAIQLATAIRQHKHAEVLELVSELLARGEHPMKINAALLTMFRRWLIVKTARSVSDEVLAKRLNLTNPKRLYYLRQETAGLEVGWLRNCAIALFEIECKLKRGLDEDSYKLALLAIT
jgi:DNA polymerase-3 subunit delta